MIASRRQKPSFTAASPTLHENANLTLDILSRAYFSAYGAAPPSYSIRRSLDHPANTTHAGQLHAAVLQRKTVTLSKIRGRPVYPLVFRLDHGAAFPADQKLPRMGMVRVVAGDKRSRAVKPVRQPDFNQEIQAAIDACRCDGSVLRADKVKQLVGRDRPLRRQELAQNCPTLPGEPSATSTADGFGLSKRRCPDLPVRHTALLTYISTDHSRSACACAVRRLGSAN